MILRKRSMLLGSQRTAQAAARVGCTAVLVYCPLTYSTTVAQPPRFVLVELLLASLMLNAPASDWQPLQFARSDIARKCKEQSCILEVAHALRLLGRSM